MHTCRHIFAKSLQLIADADDIILRARTRKDLVEGFRFLESAVVRIGLKINENKTKYMAMNTRWLMDIRVLEIERDTFEHLRTFTYLGTVLSKSTNVTEEDRNRIAIANRCYFSFHKGVKSNFVSRITKSLLYKTLVRPIVYGTEGWTLSQMNEKMVDVFERRILRGIYGPWRVAV
jgi:hypothetical protein